MATSIDLFRSFFLSGLKFAQRAALLSNTEYCRANTKTMQRPSVVMQPLPCRTEFCTYPVSPCMYRGVSKGGTDKGEYTENVLISYETTSGTNLYRHRTHCMQ